MNTARRLDGAPAGSETEAHAREQLGAIRVISNLCDELERELG